MKFKIRCSAIGSIMTNPRTKKAQEAGELSETCKQYVREWYLQERYGRKKLGTTKPMLKGIENEIDGIRALEQARGEKGYFKNEEFFENDFMMGTPDIVLKKEVIDIKSSYDLFTFHKADGVKTATSLTGYGWQLMGYMHLTGRKEASLAYCLVDSPEWVVESEIKKAWYAMHIDSPEEQEYFDTKVEPMIRANHKYIGVKGVPDIPLSERVREYSLAYDADKVKEIEERVALINDYLNNRLEELWK